MPTDRVTQAPVEALITADGTATTRITQAPVQALVKTSTALSVRVTQGAIAQVLTHLSIPSRISQLAVQVLIPNIPPPEIELPDHGLGLTWVELTLLD